MKSIALLLGIVISVILIGYSAVQMEEERDASRAYYDQKEFEEMLGYYSTDYGTPDYIEVTHTAGIVVGILTLALLVINCSLLRPLKSRRGLFISTIVMIGCCSLCGIFSTVVMTSSGGVSFYEVGVLWILLAILSIIFYSVALIVSRKPVHQIQTN